MYAKFWGVALLFASTMVAQTDWAGFAAGLRSKYGPSLLRETFVPKPGVEMVVDYAANGNVCRIQLPPMAPEHDSRVQSTHAMDEFLLELVPAIMRGKFLRRGAFTSGPNSVQSTEYENVIMSESSWGTERKGITISFPKEQCRDQYR